MRSARDLLEELNASDESPRIEAKLRDRGLLGKQGAGNRSYYVLSEPEPADAPAELATFQEEVATFPAELATLPPELATLLADERRSRPQKALRDLIRRLCAWKALTVDELATLLRRDRHYLRNKHLTLMVRQGLLRLRYPESPNHPHQAYVAPGRNEDPSD